ncbi:MAG: hypothetical protein HOP23_07795 [Methylococcaceae bacterium]|nr:hypothetical protein [Methylococcaceae bacterium]
MRHNSLNADDELVFPLHKRVIVQYSKDSSGSRELHLYYGDKEISFDEPELFEFGENLAKQSRFVAKTATEWGQCYDWPRIQRLLEQLIDEGILQYADDTDVEPIITPEDKQPSPLPPAFTSVPHTWLECEAITSVLTGRTLDLSYLELVIPVFRVAHIAMDAEGRQIGEANVFPKALRFEIPTEWRICPYPGSRYLDERPMNITALKCMRTNWSQMMVALLQIRNAYLQRFPLGPEGWTVGRLEAFSTLVLAVPTYLLMRHRQRVPNGELHPALSSLFRVTDGLRMIMHQMIFVPFGEPTRPAHTPITSTEIYEYSERNHAFSSEHGVCAGPKPMIDEFLNVIVNGEPIKDAEAVILDPQVQIALDNINPAFEYGLYGHMAHVTVFSIWPVMTRTYEQLWEIIESWPANKTDTLATFHQHLQTQIHILKTRTYHATEDLRANRQRGYSDIYNYCVIGLGLEHEQKSLTEQIAPVMQTRHKRVLKQLRTILQRKCGMLHTPKNRDIENLLTCLMNYFLQAQAILRLAEESQMAINKLLGRPSPLHAFDVADINIHNLLNGDAEKRLAYLTDVIEELFNIRITIAKDSIEITENSEIVLQKNSDHKKNF